MEGLAELTAAVRHVSREIARELGFMENRVFDLGISHSQCHALLETETSGALGLQDLSRRLRLDKSTLSRAAADLVKKGLLKTGRSSEDAREKPLSLTPSGQKLATRIHTAANRQVENALSQLNEKERAAVLEGLSLYSRALSNSRIASQFEIRPIAKRDNAAVAKMMRQVMSEFDVRGHGCSANDPEIDGMFRAYRPPSAAYFVLAFKGRVIGGAGIAPLKGGGKDICELQKMYFLPGTRGLGYGQKMMEICLKTAKKMGYRHCYLETLERMHQAQKLYAKNGFRKLREPLGNTGHSICHVWYMKDL
jgi:putative acetyltransferase